MRPMQIREDILLQVECAILRIKNQSEGSLGRNAFKRG